MKFKRGQKVHMYGCGDGSSTFWIGAKGKVVGFNHKWGIVIVAPDEFPKERHEMHEKQLRKVRK